MNHPPVNVTIDSGAIQTRFSTRFSTNDSRELSGKITSPAYVNGGLPYSLRWHLPDYTFGLGLDIGLSQTTSLTLGGDYSAIGPTGTWGGFAGLGFHSAGPLMGIRVDAGVMLSGMKHDAYTMVVTTASSFFGTSTDTGFYHDVGNDLTFDFYAMLTVNSRFKASPVNIFVNASVLRQTLLNFAPTVQSEFSPFAITGPSSGDAEYRATVLSITPGISLDASPTMRVLLGWRFIVVSNSDLSGSKFGSPLLQVDYTF